MELVEPAPHVFESSLNFEGSEGQYELVVGPVWEGQPGIVFGGFSVAVVLRAAGLECAASRPVSVACQFLRALPVGEPIHIAVTPVRRGRSSELVRVSLTHAGKHAVEALVRTSNALDGPLITSRHSPDLREPASFRSTRDIQREDGWERYPLWEDHMEVRADWSGQGNHGTITWTRFADGLVYDDPFMEAARYAFNSDHQAPAILSHLGYLLGPRRTELPWGFTNLDMLMHIHKVHGTDWLCSVADATGGADGIASAQTQVWSRTGELLASAASQVAFFSTAGERLYG